MFGQKTQSAWFFDSSVHLEAVSRLLYLAENRESLGIVSGPDGSGRSKVLSKVREELTRYGTMTLLKNLSGLDDEAALWQLAESCSPRVRSTMRRHELLSLLRDELTGRAQCGVQTVVLLDDYQRAISDLSTFLRILLSMASQCNGMLTIIVATGKPLPAEFASQAFVPIQLAPLDTAESSDFVRSLMSRQAIRLSSLDESAVRAISITGTGNAAKMSKICELLRVIHETSPDTRITEETVYSVLSEFSTDAHSSAVVHPPVMRAS
jgi:hypothetical protein